MIESSWKRIAGVHVQSDGDIAMVWLAQNKTDDCIHLYDACIFKREVLAVIAEGINARGRWIPVAWEKKAKDTADKLLERGCKMLRDSNDDSDSMAEAISRDIWERMRTHRFKVDKRLKNWLEEKQGFSRDKQKIPRDTFPLMSATRHAISQLNFAKRQAPPRSKRKHQKRIAIV